MDTGGGATTADVARVAYVPTTPLAWLLLKNALLTIVTLGIYRFWAKTTLRRFFWGSIRIGDEPLEYTGRGIELFIGFLIILAIFIGVALVQGLVQFLSLISPIGAGALQFVNLITVGLLVQAAIFRARRYRLSRTLWRGIRAGQDGSTWRYIGMAVGYGLLCLVTLGIAIPWARVALERYVMTNTRFGDRHFGFEATGRKLLPKWLALYGAIALVIVAAIVIEKTDILYVVNSKDPKDPAFEATFGRIAIFYVLLLLVGGLGLILYRVAEFRYFTGCASLGDVRFVSAARGWRIALIPVLYLLGIFAVITVVAAPFTLIFIVGIGAAVASKGAAPPTELAIGAGIVFVLIFFVLSYVLNYLWLYVPILKHLCRTFEVRNIAAAEQIAQSTAPTPRFGEGLADAFDIGVM